MRRGEENYKRGLLNNADTEYFLAHKASESKLEASVQPEEKPKPQKKVNK